MKTAPRRHSRGKRYFVAHKSVAGSSGTNRLEEHLAATLVASGRRFLFGENQDLTLIDYQVPLRATTYDRGLRNIDLFGISDRWLVIELKVLRPNHTADTPLAALLEGLAYNAIIEANRDDIASELTIKGFVSGAEKAAVAVLAPSSYWEYWHTKAAAGNWKRPLLDLAVQLDHHLGVAPLFLSIPSRWETSPTSFVDLSDGINPN